MIFTSLRKVDKIDTCCFYFINPKSVQKNNFQNAFQVKGSEFIDDLENKVVAMQCHKSTVRVCTAEKLGSCMAHIIKKASLDSGSYPRQLELLSCYGGEALESGSSHAEEMAKGWLKVTGQDYVTIKAARGNTWGSLNSIGVKKWGRTIIQTPGDSFGLLVTYTVHKDGTISERTR